MNDSLPGLLSIAIAYLAGSVPFGLLIGRLVGKIDVRKCGSGNIGATNVGRVLGTKWGLLVFLLDFLKGLGPTALAPRLLIGTESEALIHWQVAAGIAAIVGHMFPCWLGFRGGKGVATALGVVACLGLWATGAAVLTFGLSFAIWRIVSLASILASIAFAFCQLMLLSPGLVSQRNWSLSAFSLLVPALIIARHRGNIVRIIYGEEKKYRSGEKS